MGHQRRLTGGAGIKVRVVKGANLAMERVDATVHDWPLATWSTSRSPTPTTSGCSMRAHARSDTDASSASASRVTTSSTSPSHGCSRAPRRDRPRRDRDAARHGHRPRRGRAARRPADCCCTRRSCTRRSSTPRSATWCAASRRTPAPITSCRGCSNSTTPPSTRGNAIASPRRWPDLDLDLPAPSRTQDRLHPSLRTRVRRLRERTGHRPGARRQPAVGPRHPGAQRDVEARRGDHRGGGHAERRGAPHDRLAFGTGRRHLGQGAGHRSRRAARPGRRGARRVPRSAHRGHGGETGKTLAEADVEVSEVVDFAHYYAGSSPRTGRGRRRRLRAGRRDRRRAAVELSGRDPRRRVYSRPSQPEAPCCSSRPGRPSAPAPCWPRRSGRRASPAS